MSDAKRDSRRQIHAEKVAASRALRLSVPAEARPAPVSRKDWLRQRKEQLQAARIAGRFSQGREAEQVEVEIVRRGGLARQLRVAPLRKDDMPEAWYL